MQPAVIAASPASAHTSACTPDALCDECLDALRDAPLEGEELDFEPANDTRDPWAEALDRDPGAYFNPALCGGGR